MLDNRPTGSFLYHHAGFKFTLFKFSRPELTEDIALQRNPVFYKFTTNCIKNSWECWSTAVNVRGNDRWCTPPTAIIPQISCPAAVAKLSSGNRGNLSSFRKSNNLFREKQLELTVYLLYIRSIDRANLFPWSRCQNWLHITISNLDAQLKKYTSIFSAYSKKRSFILIGYCWSFSGTLIRSSCFSQSKGIVLERS